MRSALARGGIDIIKDDHGLADQVYSPFAARVRACAAAVREANKAGGGHAVYVPSLSGDLDQLRRQISLAKEEGLDAVLVAVELALETGPPGKVSVEHVVNVLGRLHAQPAPPTAATHLKITTPPLADTARYDSLRADSSADDAVDADITIERAGHEV